MTFAAASFSVASFSPQAFLFDGVAPVVIAPNGNRRQEYQPTYYELKERRDIERKFEEAELNLKANQIKVETLEFKRLSDLADNAMQLELLQLLAQQQELTQLIERLQQQRLRALQDDDDLIAILMCLN